jgi:hypothetical protein
LCAVTEVWYSADPIGREYDWAKCLATLSKTTIHLARFGATDCGCPAHLYYFAHRPLFRSFQERVKELCSDHAAVRRLVLKPAEASNVSATGFETDYSEFFER